MKDRKSARRIRQFRVKRNEDYWEGIAVSVVFGTLVALEILAIVSFRPWW